MQRLWSVVVALTVSTVVAGCGSDPAPTPPASGSVSTARSTTIPNATVVRYELTGTAVTVDGTYAEPAGASEKMVQLSNTALPWGKNFSLPVNHLFVAGVVAQGPNLESTITCKILKNGTVVAEQTGSVVDCRAEIR